MKWKVLALAGWLVALRAIVVVFRLEGQRQAALRASDKALTLLMPDAKGRLRRLTAADLVPLGEDLAAAVSGRRVRREVRDSVGLARALAAAGGVA